MSGAKGKGELLINHHRIPPAAETHDKTKAERNPKEKKGKNMKNFKRILSIALIAIMALGIMSIGMFAQTVAVDETGNNGASITITLPTDPAPSQSTTYSVYRIFDASTDGTNIAYRLVEGKTTAPAGFVVDTAGNVTYNGTGGAQLTAEDIAAIKAYVAAAPAIAPVWFGDVPAGDTTLVLTGLKYGYYYITTTTGSLVTVDSTKPNATVNDKNTLSDIDKSAGSEYDAAALDAIAAVGSSQPFTIQVTKGKGATVLSITDNMENLTFNNDVTVKAGGDVLANANYTVTGNEGDTSFTVDFTKDYLSNVVDSDVVLTINYTATVTSDALSLNPATNKATLTTDNENTYETKVIDVYNAKIEINKTGANSAPLAEAGFVLKNADSKYYKLADSVITWVNNIDDATEKKTDANGIASFTGLAAGTYTLVEKTVPAGYKKAADTDVTIAADTYTELNLNPVAAIVNTPGTTLPATGGIGTTIFYIVGSILVVGAGIVLITKKRMSVK